MSPGILNLKTNSAVRPASRFASRLLACSAMVSLCAASFADAQVDQSLGFDFSASSFSNLVSLRHDVQGINAKFIDIGLGQTASYSLSENTFDQYGLNLDINDDQNLFAGFGGSFTDSSRGLDGFVDNQFTRERFSVSVSGGGNVEWTQSTFGDEGYLDPEFDFFDYTDEELEQTVWVRSHFLQSSYEVEINPIALGRVAIRPKSQGGIVHNDFSGFGYDISGSVGLSLLGEEDELDLFFEESNLYIDVPGGSYGAGDGELVLASGYNSDGVGELAALIFKGWSPTDRMTYTFDATSKLVYEPSEGIRFGGASVRVGAILNPTDNWSLQASSNVDFSPDFPPDYSVEGSIRYSGFDKVQPHARFSGYFSDGSARLSLPFGLSSDIGDRLLYSVDISPTYSSDSNQFDVSGSISLTLLAPPLVVDGRDSEFSLSSSATWLTGDRSISLSGKSYF